MIRNQHITLKTCKYMESIKQSTTQGNYLRALFIGLFQLINKEEMIEFSGKLNGRLNLVDDH